MLVCCLFLCLLVFGGGGSHFHNDAEYAAIAVAAATAVYSLLIPTLHTGIIRAVRTAKKKSSPNRAQCDRPNGGVTRTYVPQTPPTKA